MSKGKSDALMKSVYMRVGLSLNISLKKFHLKQISVIKDILDRVKLCLDCDRNGVPQKYILVKNRLKWNFRDCENDSILQEKKWPSHVVQK